MPDGQKHSGKLNLWNVCAVYLLISLLMTEIVKHLMRYIGGFGRELAE